MMQKKYWTYNELDHIKIAQMVSHLGVSESISKILLNRGIETIEEAENFLYPNIEKLHDPFLLKDMDKVVYRIKEAIKNQEKICIYGDYDVDGIGSTAIMLKYFKSIDHPISYYIPNRMEEGYGLNKDGIKQIVDEGAQLIITVDCGITSIEEVDYANSLGVDIIITDHHECQDILPKAYGIINPKQKDCSYPFDKICGCGLALKLIQALTPKEVFKKTIYDYIDIVAIATIADIVSLIDENRIIVRAGLEYLPKSKNLGIQALLKVCGLMNKKLSAGNIAFGIAPRINAAGRISSADAGVRLLTATDLETAEELAELLNSENKYRQEIETNILNEAIHIIERDPLYAKEKVLVIYKEDWHPGVIGIVASRIVEKYYKPTIILGIDEGIGKGSARSIPGFNLFDAMSRCKDLFIKFGGHEQAAGLSLSIENIQVFRKQINLIADSILTEEDFVPKIFYDDMLKLQDVNEKLIMELEQLEPFGLGNPSPKFISKDLSPIEVRNVGNDDKHLKLKLEHCGTYIDGIGFGLGELQQLIDAEDKIDILYSPEINLYNGNRNLQFNIKDIKIKLSKNHQKHPILREYYKNFRLNEYKINSDSLNSSIKIVRGEKSKLVRDKMKEASSTRPLLIMVNTLQQAYSLLALLEYKENSSQTNISISFNIPIHNNKEYEVYTVINPVIDKIDYKRYNSIILYDMFYFLNELQCFIEQNCIEKTIFLYEDGDEKANSHVLDHITPTRDQLVGIYRYLKEHSNGKVSASFEHIAEELMIQYKLFLNEKLFHHALIIFSEGELLTYHYDNFIYNIQILEPKGKINIDQLRFSQYLKGKKHEYNDFVNKWIQLL